MHRVVRVAFGRAMDVTQTRRVGWAVVHRRQHRHNGTMPRRSRLQLRRPVRSICVVHWTIATLICGISNSGSSNSRNHQSGIICNNAKKPRWLFTSGSIGSRVRTGRRLSVVTPMWPRRPGTRASPKRGFNEPSKRASGSGTFTGRIRVRLPVVIAKRIMTTKPRVIRPR